MNEEKTRQTKKDYRKPQVNRVKLVPTMRILGTCYLDSGEQLMSGCEPQGGEACHIG